MKQYIIQLVILTLIQLLPVCAHAKQSFFEQRYRGWLWFDEPIVEQPNLEEKQDTAEEQSKAPTLEEMQRAKHDNEQFAEELELLRHLAVRHPENLEYIKLYKFKEKEMMDNAQILGLNWLMANFLNPEIMDELKSPQNIYGRKILAKEKKSNDQSILQALGDKVELFIFRQDGCPYCSTLEKHLKRFADKYSFKVEAITPDNSQSQYFKSNSSPELIEALGLELMPTVIAVVNNTRQRFELARGAVSVVDLEKKALLLAKYLGMAESKQTQRKSTAIGARQWSE